MSLVCQISPPVLLHLPPFASVLENADNKEWAETGQVWSQVQKNEFQEMDADKDGYLTREELLVCRT